MRGICYNCRQCSYKWNNPPGCFSIKCPSCNSRQINVIDSFSFDKWKKIDEASEEYRQYEENRIWDYCKSIWEDGVV